VFSKTNVSIVLTELGRGEEALPLLAQARAEIGQLARNHPEDAVSEGTILGWSAMTYAALGRDDDATQADDDKVAAALRAPNADKNEDVQFLVANAHGEIAKWQLNLGHLDEALALANRAMAELTTLNVRDPSNINNIAEIVSTQVFLAYLLADSGNIVGAREQLRQASARQTMLMARPTPKRAWRLTHQGRIAEARGRLAANDNERAEAQANLAAYMADVHHYESEGGVVPPLDAVLIASAGLMQGDLLVRAGHPERARAAWLAAANRIRPLAERLLPAAMTQLGQLDFRLGDVQDAHAWADKVVRTTYRHPTFADLQQRLGPTQLAGGATRP
jgi:tetratricopeptide (TPR) repeat protein